MNSTNNNDCGKIRADRKRNYEYGKENFLKRYRYTIQKQQPVREVKYKSRYFN